MLSETCGQMSEIYCICRKLTYCHIPEGFPAQLDIPSKMMYNIFDIIRHSAGIQKGECTMKHRLLSAVTALSLIAGMLPAGAAVSAAEAL